MGIGKEWCLAAVLSAACACACATAMTEPRVAASRGFVGKVITEWLADGRRMKILAPFAFIAGTGLHWNVPEGSIVDGASIPRFAWTIIGGPFEGLYRNASVIHDVACDQKIQPWQDVHGVFYEAMLASGVSPTKAKVMYAAVYHFGPRWEQRLVLRDVSEDEVNRQAVLMVGSNMKVAMERLPSPACTSPPCAPAERRFDALIQYKPESKHLSEAQFQELEAKIESGDINLGEIETYGLP